MYWSFCFRQVVFVKPSRSLNLDKTSKQSSFWWKHRRSLTRGALSLQVTESGSDVGISLSLAIGLHQKYMGRLRSRGGKWISLRDSAKLNGNLLYVFVSILFSKTSWFSMYAALKFVQFQAFVSRRGEAVRCSVVTVKPRALNDIVRQCGVVVLRQLFIVFMNEF